VSHMAAVELVVLGAVCRRRGLPPPPSRLESLVDDVRRFEQESGHEVAALVTALRKRLPESQRPLLHLGLTASDIQDSANALRYRSALQAVTIPAAVELLNDLLILAESLVGVPQVGRTHGQAAEPIDAGYALATRAARLANRINAIVKATQSLCGKVSGSVGAYSALGLVVDDPVELESEVLKELGLKVPPASSQIVPHESLLDLLHALTSTWGVLADLADEMRNLARSEIAEVELHAPGVGSSSMPGKRNPIDFENVKSSWKAYMPRMATAYMDQVSEHQRDLTNSLTARYVPEVISMFTYATRRLRSGLARVKFDQQAIRANLIAMAPVLRSQNLEVRHRLKLEVDAGTDIVAWASDYTRHAREQAPEVIAQCRRLTSHLTEQVQTLR
jgi:adenylosuccinate lyase